MNTILNCLKGIINAWYGQNETSSEVNEDSEESHTSEAEPGTLVREPSEETLSRNNIIISEMLASLSILEEAEASVFEKHPINQSYRTKTFAGLSEILELDTKDEMEANDPQETSIPERKPFPEKDSNLPDIDNRRANIITEIINTERDYVKSLRDIHEGYYRQCQKAKDLFPHARLVTLFSNVGDIYKMHKRLLSSMEKKYKLREPHSSEFGACFVEQILDINTFYPPNTQSVLQKKGFMMYAKYCKDHKEALEEWTKLIMVEKYVYFFEVCRMHQQMINLPLDGFLIMPVQRICKYPLFLKELFKATLPSHSDYAKVEEAVVAMREVLDAINAEKGEGENEAKLSKFQKSVLNWKGDDITVRSTQLIHRGDLVLVNDRGARAKNYVAFLFDHQMFLCKKDLIRRYTLYYKERIYMETCILIDVDDGDDLEFDCKVKNAFKLRSKLFEERCRLFFAKTPADKQLWLCAFEEERSIAEGNKLREDSYYNFPALNVSTVMPEQSFISQPKRRKSVNLLKFRKRLFS